MLARGGSQQIGAAHYMRDALCAIVHHHRQLVGPLAIGAAQDEITHFGCHILALAAHPAIFEANDSGRHAHSPGARRAPWRQAVAAGARVGVLAIGAQRGLCRA